VIYTGQHIQHTKMFDNTNFPWIGSMSPEIRTLGHMLRDAGYYTAYKGKWHLTRAFDQEFPPKQLFTNEMEAYGFADYASPGDVVGHTLGGYTFDHVIAGSAISWLRRVGGALRDEGTPWALTVSLVNPHDIMYFNTDVPGQSVQDNGRLMARAAPAPRHAMYAAEWDLPIPASLTQRFDEPGRPKAHGEFSKAWDCVLGHIPPEEERWRRFSASWTGWGWRTTRSSSTPPITVRVAVPTVCAARVHSPIGRPFTFPCTWYIRTCAVGRRAPH
jgi:arylsulfatase